LKTEYFQLIQIKADKNKTTEEKGLFYFYLLLVSEDNSLSD
jgi:hypothetical protein